MNRLDGRVALVTGGASGIGKATALRLASEGASLVITDVSDTDVSDTGGSDMYGASDLSGGAGPAVAVQIAEAGGRAVFVHHDVTSEDDWLTAVSLALEEFGGLDILVNNPGRAELATIEETTLQVWERTIATDQTAVFLGMKAASELLAKSGHGSVINISSSANAPGGFGTSPACRAATGAVRTLTKNVARQWAAAGVRVNSINARFIQSPVLEPETATDADELALSMTPMGRLGRPEEVAAGVAFLASDDASFVTGSELDIDGGYLSR